MPADDLTLHLGTIIDQAKELGLAIRLAVPNDLAVIGGKPAQKAQLGTIVKLATALGLRVKWLNEGTLVAIGLPKHHNGKEVSKQTPESRPAVLCISGPEGRQGDGTNQSA